MSFDAPSTSPSNATGIDVGQSPWIKHAYARLTLPDEMTLRRLWESEETLKGVARQLQVSVDSAAVWLANIEIFVKDVPVISRRELQAAIDERQSIEDICQQHHVTGGTVAVELRRHRLRQGRNARHIR